MFPSFPTSLKYRRAKKELENALISWDSAKLVIYLLRSAEIQPRTGTVKFVRSPYTGAPDSICWARTASPTVNAPVRRAAAALSRFTLPLSQARRHATLRKLVPLFHIARSFCHVCCLYRARTELHYVSRKLRHSHYIYLEASSTVEDGILLVADCASMNALKSFPPRKKLTRNVQILITKTRQICENKKMTWHENMGEKKEDIAKRYSASSRWNWI